MFEWIGALDSQADWGSKPDSSSLPRHFFPQVLLWLSLGACRAVLEMLRVQYPGPRGPRGPGGGDCRR